MKTVLVVEDEFGVADLIATALEDEGFRVLKAAHGAQALDRLADERPDLIITDYMMPVLDGPRFATKVRASAEYADIPIIMMSAMPEASVRERFDGYAGFIQKPFRLTELIDAVGRLLQPA